LDNATVTRGFWFWGLAKLLQTPTLRISKKSGKSWVQFRAIFEDNSSTFTPNFLVAWDSDAEYIATLHEGDLVFLEGKPSWEKREDRSGNERWYLIIKVMKVKREGRLTGADDATPDEIDTSPF
jgi:single-stranded DNA-binding protein